eukprot:CAMPEP_0194340110 /NCGR_PEP_ID=MMETSP0171-20130528/85279_1 /TAXON_ID=218684 /ORGANISM="Corethron pennatum, Strain L29A3" /LENGTH=768 /DNA_ID=CAMNT_0039104933 /DNA_START=204 /DNA_END=2510 /DNA_ORIENTATION=-
MEPARPFFPLLLLLLLYALADGFNPHTFSPRKSSGAVAFRRFSEWTARARGDPQESAPGDDTPEALRVPAARRRGDTVTAAGTMWETSKDAAYAAISKATSLTKERRGGVSPPPLVGGYQDDRRVPAGGDDARRRELLEREAEERFRKREGSKMGARARAAKDGVYEVSDALAGVLPRAKSRGGGFVRDSVDPGVPYVPSRNVSEKRPETLEKTGGQVGWEMAKEVIYGTADGVKGAVRAVAEAPKAAQALSSTAASAVESAVRAAKSVPSNVARTVDDIKSIPSRVEKKVDEVQTAVDDVTKKVEATTTAVLAVPSKVKKAAEDAGAAAKGVKTKVLVLTGREEPPAPPPDTGAKTALGVAASVVGSTGKVAWFVGKNVGRGALSLGSVGWGALRTNSPKELGGVDGAPEGESIDRSTKDNSGAETIAFVDASPYDKGIVKGRTNDSESVDLLESNNNLFGGGRGSENPDIDDTVGEEATSFVNKAEGLREDEDLDADDRSGDAAASSTSLASPAGDNIDALFFADVVKEDVLSTPDAASDSRAIEQRVGDLSAEKKLSETLGSRETSSDTKGVKKERDIEDKTSVRFPPYLQKSVKDSVNKPRRDVDLVLVAAKEEDVRPLSPSNVPDLIGFGPEIVEYEGRPVLRENLPIDEAVKLARMAADIATQEAESTKNILSGKEGVGPSGLQEDEETSSDGEGSSGIQVTGAEEVLSTSDIVETEITKETMRPVFREDMTIKEALRLAQMAADDSVRDADATRDILKKKK